MGDEHHLVAQELTLRAVIDHLDAQGRIVPNGYVAVPYQKELGTATQAIEFAIGIDDHFDRLSFLEGWLYGDVSEWPDYVAMIAAAPKGDK